MTLFLKKTGLFLGYFTLFIFVFSLCYKFIYKITLNDIPAPNLSNSYSFNEKMKFLKNKKQKADVISLGSSMNLNNLHSETVIKRLHSESYLNTASWGSDMKVDYQLLKIFYKLYKPRTLIISSNIMDFNDNGIRIKFSFVEKYLQPHTTSSNFYLSKIFNVKYYLKNFKYAKKVRTCINEYEYLGYDKYGGLNYIDKNFKIDAGRWNDKRVDAEINLIQYSYLDSISTFCKSNNISFLFFQSPIRNGIYSTFNNNEKNVLITHIKKIETILKRDQHKFVNSNIVIWEDNLFVDSTHLNSKGAKIYTNYCFDNINNTFEQSSK